MKRFILVDHSITGLAGHHYEYAVHVLRAAARAGYKPVLVANRRFREADLPWEVLPLFEFGFWPAPRSTTFLKAVKKMAAWFAPRLASLRIRLRYSELGLAWSSRSSWPKYLFRRHGEGAPALIRLVSLAAVTFLDIARWSVILVLSPLVIIIGLSFLFYTLLKLLVSTRQPAAKGPSQPISVRLMNAARQSAHPMALLNAVLERLGIHGRTRPPAWKQQAAAFGRDAGRMLKSLLPRKGDIIFFPTISEHDMEGLVNELDRTKAGLEAGWHFLFRRNIYTGSRADYPAQDEKLEALRLVFERVQRSVVAARSFFYTDTDELTEQWDRLGLVRFHTLPVPHTYKVSDRMQRGGPLRLTYLGDARTEKGFPLLPDLAAKLETDYLATGKARLVLQCNYNIPGGEPHVAIARGELESMPGGYIEFHRKPLTSEEYCRLLLTADVNLLCYDADNYYARSSGILVESLAVGIPVIVPSGCWLSRQFLARQIEYVEGLRSEMTLLSVKAITDLWWRDERNQQPGKLKSGDLLRIYHGQSPQTMLEVPSGATHVVFRGEFAMGTQSLVGSISDIGWDDSPVIGGNREFCMEAVSGSKRAVIFSELRPNTPKIAISLRTGHATETAWLSSLSVEFFRAPEGRRVPKGAVGLSYSKTAEIPGLVADLIDHYSHYQRTAAEFSQNWREYHNPDRLLRDMEKLAGLLPTGGESPLARTERVAV